MFGGNPCPSVDYTEQRECSAPPCTTTVAPAPETTIGAVATSNLACNPATWDKYSWDCCTAENPCYVGEGDCDKDEQCAGELVCGKRNCPDTFKARAFGRRPDCCQQPTSFPAQEESTEAASPAEPQPKTKAACNPAKCEKFTFQCCTPDSPCFAGEGDCDR